MDEAEWLSSTDPQAMLRFITQMSDSPDRPLYPYKPSDRKLRLFAVAAWRVESPSSPHEGWLEALRQLEEVADGRRRALTRWAEGYICAAPNVSALLLHLSGLWVGGNVDPARRRDNVTIAATLLRDIIGNPFRPVVLSYDITCSYCKGTGEITWFPTKVDNHSPLFREEQCSSCKGSGKLAHRPGWLTPQVLSLAQAAYDERPGRACPVCNGTARHENPPGRRRGAGAQAFFPCPGCGGAGRVVDGALDPVRLAVLADALEESGCPSSSGRTVSQIIEARRHAVIGGCCERFANHMACDCLTEAEPDGLLEHLRSPGPHYRGMWSLDILLGKE